MKTLNLFHFVLHVKNLIVEMQILALSSFLVEHFGSGFGAFETVKCLGFYTINHVQNVKELCCF